MEVNGKLHAPATSLSRGKNPHYQWNTRLNGPNRTISCAFQKLDPRLYQQWPTSFYHPYPPNYWISHYCKVIYKGIPIKTTHMNCSRQKPWKTATVYTDRHSIHLPMDPCASNFLNCCWNNSLHVCPTLIYDPSAISIQGSDITINAQLYQELCETLLV